MPEIPQQWQWLIATLVALAGVAVPLFGIKIRRRKRTLDGLPADLSKAEKQLTAERQALLNNVKTRVDQWFQDGFAKQVDIKLRYTEALEAVDPIWLGQWYVGEIEEIPQNADIGTLYEGSQGQILLLGDPGTGKSNELHKLLHALWSKATSSPGQPVPVLLNLTSWAVDQHPSLEDWIAKELQASYQVSAQRSRDWAGRVIPLLDGLDEVRENVQNACLEAIALYARQPVGGGPGKSVVVASRRKEYDRLIERVKMPAAQVNQLDRAELDALLRAPKLLNVSRTLEADDRDPTHTAKLRDALTTPLMLALLYEGAGAAPSGEERPEDRIYERFLDATLDNLEDRHGFPAEQSKRWLGWLAAQLEGRNEARIDLEDLGPDWLPDQRGRRLAGLLFGLVLGLVGGLVGGLLFGLVGGLVGGLVFGLVGGMEQRRHPAEALELTLAGLGRGLVVGLVGGLVFGLYFGLYFGLLFGLFSGLLVGLAFGLILGLAFGLILGLILGLAFGLILGLILGLAFGLILGLVFGLDEAFEAKPVTERTAPADGVRRSLRYALAFAIPMTLLGAALAPFVPVPETLLEAQDRAVDAALEGTFGAIPALIAMAGVLLGFSKGGYFALSYYIIRLLLRRRNLAPRRYVAFLTQAAKQGILKPVGGGFQFRHRELRRFLAERYGAEWLERPSQQSEMP